MAIDAYMFFDPPKAKKHDITVKGETQDDVGVKSSSFEIIDFKWSASALGDDTKEKSKGKDGATKSVTAPSPDITNLAGGKIKVEGFSVSKPFDSASLNLFQACVTEGCEFAKATVLFRKMGNDGKPFVFLAFEFENVRVEKIEWKIAAIEGDKPDQEDLDFNFDKCELFYTPQTQAGEKAATFVKSTKKAVSWTRQTSSSK